MLGPRLFTPLPGETHAGRVANLVGPAHPEQALAVYGVSYLAMLPDTFGGGILHLSLKSHFGILIEEAT